MPIADDFSISATGDIRYVSGNTVYSVLDLHAWLQSLACNATTTGNDLLDIFSPNPSKLDGPRNSAIASRLNLLSSGSVSFNIDDTTAQYINFGSILQQNGQVQYSGLKTIGTIVPGSPVYVVQNGNKLTQYWGNGHIQILVKVETGGVYIDGGIVTAYSRKWGQTYSNFSVNLSPGGEINAALSTAIDPNIVLTEAQAALLSSKVSVTFGDTTQDLGNGNGPKLYKGTVTLSNGCTVQEAYQYLQYLTRDNSTAVLNGIPGWRYRSLDPTYTEIQTAPFGTFAGGTLFMARGWFLTGVLATESINYQLIAADGTIQIPPAIGTINITNLVAGSRIQLYNQTTSTEVVNTSVSGTSYSYTYTNGTVISTNDVIRIRITKAGYLPQTGNSVAANIGFSAIANQQVDTVYVLNGIDGSTVTECVADYVNNEIDITQSSGTTSVKRIYAWLQYIQTTSTGINNWFNCISADDEANYKINVIVANIRLMNTISTPLQVIDGRLYHSDNTTVISPTSNSIQMDPNRVYPTNALITSVNQAVIAARLAASLSA